MRNALSVSIAVCAAALLVVVYLTALDNTFGNGDEIIYAELIRGMHRTGDYLTMRFQGEVALQRPVIPVTLYALTSRLIPGEAGARALPALISALSALAAGAVVWRRGKSLLAGAATAVFCAAIPTYFVSGRMVFSDPPLVLCCLGALAATLAAQDDPRWFPWIGVSLGGAVAMKSMGAGPAAIALFPWIVAAARRHPRRSLRLGWTIGSFVVLAAPFYVVGLAVYGSRFIADHFGYHLVARAQGNLGYGWTSPFAYFEHIWRIDGPIVSLVLLGGIVAAAVLAVRLRNRDLGVAATAAAGILLLFSAVGTKLAHYLLLFYPFAAVCAGLLLARVRLLALPALVLAAALLYRSSGTPNFSADDESVPAAIILGRAAGAATAPGEPVYSLDWYAPAVAYYADRPWRLLATMESEVRIVGSVDIFAKVGVVRRAPPWPTGRFLVASDRQHLAAAAAMTPPLVLRRPLAADGGYELWEAGP